MNLIYLLFLSLLTSLQAEKIDWQRPFVVGASLSDGFYLPEMGIPFLSPRSKQLGLHHHLKAALKVPHGRISNLGSNWLFLATEPKGAFQVKRAREGKATVVFAIDFLFWYLSSEPKLRGRGYQELSRMEFFELGLAHLATFECPVVVGNIPDAASSVGRVLSPGQYPGAALIVKANERFDQWLKKNPKVIKLDLLSFHQQASRNQKVTVGPVVVPAGQSRRILLQPDLLHPAQKGAKAIALLALKSLGLTDKEVDFEF